jgi:hypothetical protein
MSLPFSQRQTLSEIEDVSVDLADLRKGKTPGTGHSEPESKI